MFYNEYFTSIKDEKEKEKSILTSRAVVEQNFNSKNHLVDVDKIAKDIDAIMKESDMDTNDSICLVESLIFSTFYDAFKELGSEKGTAMLDYCFANMNDNLKKSLAPMYHQQMVKEMNNV